jgi:hypothetical protein
LTSRRPREHQPGRDFGLADLDRQREDRARLQAMFRAEQEPRPETTGWRLAGFCSDHGMEFVDEFAVDLSSVSVALSRAFRTVGARLGDVMVFRSDWTPAQPGGVISTRPTVSAPTGTHDYPVNQPEWVTPEWELDFDGSWCDDSAVTFRGPDLETFMREDPWQQPFRWLLADPA